MHLLIKRVVDLTASLVLLGLLVAPILIIFFDAKNLIKRLGYLLF